MEEYDNIIKLILTGDSCVGKSCITSVFCDNKYSDCEVTTIGVDFKTKPLIFDNKKIKLQIWDTGGQERFKSITTPYFRNAHGIILVFDLTKYESFQNLNKWLEQIDFFTREGNYKIILVGNKCDDINNLCISKDDINKFVKDNKLEYIEVSAKKNIKIEELFQIIVTNILNSNIEIRKKKISKPVIKAYKNYKCCLLI